MMTSDSVSLLVEASTSHRLIKILGANNVRTAVVEGSGTPRKAKGKVKGSKLDTKCEWRMGQHSIGLGSGRRSSHFTKDHDGYSRLLIRAKRWSRQLVKWPERQPTRVGWSCIPVHQGKSFRRKNPNGSKSVNQ